MPSKPPTKCILPVHSTCTCLACFSFNGTGLWSAAAPSTSLCARSVIHCRLSRIDGNTCPRGRSRSGVLRNDDDAVVDDDDEHDVTGAAPAAAVVTSDITWSEAAVTTAADSPSDRKSMSARPDSTDALRELTSDGCCCCSCCWCLHECWERRDVIRRSQACLHSLQRLFWKLRVTVRLSWS